MCQIKPQRTDSSAIQHHMAVHEWFWAGGKLESYFGNKPPGPFPPSPPCVSVFINAYLLRRAGSWWVVSDGRHEGDHWVGRCVPTELRVRWIDPWNASAFARRVSIIVEKRPVVMMRGNKVTAHPNESQWSMLFMISSSRQPLQRRQQPHNRNRKLSARN